MTPSASTVASQQPPEAARPGATLRVLTLIDHFAQGGAELLVSRFAAGALSAGIELSVACLAQRDGNPAAAPLLAAGTVPVTLDAPERLGPASLLAVRRHIAQLSPDLVHTHLISSDVLGPIAARSLGVPAVATLHSPGWGGQRRDLVKRRLAALARRHGCARVIAVSEYARAQYLAHGWDVPQRIVTIHNGMDLTPARGEGAAVREELGLAQDDLVVGMVSALRPEKGHEVAVEAIGLVHREMPRVRLVIVGDGPARATIERKARELGKTVVMTGRRTDVMRLLDAMDVCIHPSHADLFPGTVLEAMAASVPVLATAVGGIPEQVENGRSGVLVPAPPRAGVIATELAQLLSDAGRRATLAAAALSRYQQLFTAGPWLARTRALYDEVLAEQGAGRTRR